ncbi:unnamed protein product [Sphagnum balticum]
MVEGPGVHCVALVHRRMLQGRVFQATSPSGRFVDGAAAINGCVLSHIEAHGKNIFYFFTPKKVKEEEDVLEKLGLDAVVVHIHFGMSGSFRTFPYPGPEPREATRLQLENKKEGLVAHLSATLCVHGDLELYSCTQVAQEAAVEGVPIVSVYPGMVYGPGKLTAGNSLALMVMLQIYQSFLEAQ